MNFRHPGTCARNAGMASQRIGRSRRRVQTTLIAAAWLVPLLMAAHAWAQTPSLRLVSTAWPPFTNPPGEAQFALDLVREALTRIGVTADTAIVDEERFTLALLAGDFDGSAAVWKDPERERVLEFSDPYLENRLILVGRRGSDVSAQTLAELSGRRVVVVGGYSYGEAVTNASGPVFVRSRGEEDSLVKLLANEADYTLMDELVVQYLMNNYPEEARTRLQVGSTPLVTRSLHLAIRRERPDASSLIKRFNAELRRMIGDRTYHRLLHVDWIQADVDGDGRPELLSRTDQAGPTPPARSYDLFVSTPEPAPSGGDTRFYFGGHIYENWASVPDRYKLSGADQPNPDRATASIFRFVW